MLFQLYKVLANFLFFFWIFDRQKLPFNHPKILCLLRNYTFVLPTNSLSFIKRINRITFISSFFFFQFFLFFLSQIDCIVLPHIFHRIKKKQQRSLEMFFFFVGWSIFRLFFASLLLKKWLLDDSHLK